MKKGYQLLSLQLIDISYYKLVGITYVFNVIQLLFVTQYSDHPVYKLCLFFFLM